MFLSKSLQHYKSAREWMTLESNIVISRILSAYFLRFPLISAANAEEESAFFGGSFSQNKYFAKGRKEISRASTATSEVA
jgi:hypothetical protein